MTDTRTDYSTLTSRELDAIVAEKIMGGITCQCDHTKTVSPRFSSHTGDCLSCGRQLGRSYSTDPAASKALRDKMRADGWNYEVHGIVSRKFHAEFYASMVNGSAPDTQFVCMVDTEERAVALAALKCVDTSAAI